MKRFMSDEVRDLTKLFKRFAYRLSKSDYETFMMCVIADWVTETGCQNFDASVTADSKAGEMTWQVKIDIEDESLERAIEAARLHKCSLEGIQIIVEED